MASNQSMLFFIVGKNEPLYEAEIHKRGASGKSDASVARQSYFVVHSSLDLVDKAIWTSQNVRCEINRKGMLVSLHSMNSRCLDSVLGTLFRGCSGRSNCFDLSHTGKPFTHIVSFLSCFCTHRCISRS